MLEALALFCDKRISVKYSDGLHHISETKKLSTVL